MFFTATPSSVPCFHVDRPLSYVLVITVGLSHPNVIHSSSIVPAYSYLCCCFYNGQAKVACVSILLIITTQCGIILSAVGLLVHSLVLCHLDFAILRRVAEIDDLSCSVSKVDTASLANTL